ncbi:MAG: hypothetical protein WCY26_04570 [Thiohalobacteraceae bacterium]|nr:hypothetical protein [Gammaproteobacteria bacterium]
MPNEHSDSPRSARHYERRLHRHRRLYWQVSLPVLAVLIAGYALGYFLEALVLAVLGLLVVLLVMLREIIDVLGYLGSLQRDAAVAREVLRGEPSGAGDRPIARAPD